MPAVVVADRERCEGRSHQESARRGYRRVGESPVALLERTRSCRSSRSRSARRLPRSSCSRAGRRSRRGRARSVRGAAPRARRKAEQDSTTTTHAAIACAVARDAATSSRSSTRLSSSSSSSFLVLLIVLFFVLLFLFFFLFLFFLVLLFFFLVFFLFFLLVLGLFLDFPSSSSVVVGDRRSVLRTRSSAQRRSPTATPCGHLLEVLGADEHVAGLAALERTHDPVGSREGPSAARRARIRRTAGAAEATSSPSACRRRPRAPSRRSRRLLTGGQLAGHAASCPRGRTCSRAGPASAGRRRAEPSPRST